MRLTVSTAPCVLLIDDNVMDVELTRDAFEHARRATAIEVARSGKEALDRLFDTPPDADRRPPPLPDLIILDLKMPGIDGIEVLRRIKQAPSHQRIPVVILSSSCEEADRAMAYDAGANSYVVKPMSFDGFAEVVERLLDYWFVVNVRPPDAVYRSGGGGASEGPIRSQRQEAS